MKSHYIGSKSEYRQEMRRIAKEEIEVQKRTLCVQCQARMEAQTIAVICKVLNAQFGFGKKRLRELVDGAEAFGALIHEHGDNYGGVVEWLKTELGIDLEG